MGEYSNARTIPVGWERLTGPRDTRTFWRGVLAEVERLNVTKTDLVAVKAVVDRHLALEAWFLSLPAEFRKAHIATQTVAGVTLTTTLTAEYVKLSANAVLLDACHTDATEVHVIGTDIKVSITTAADANAGADRAFTVVIADA